MQSNVALAESGSEVPTTNVIQGPWAPRSYDPRTFSQDGMTTLGIKMVKATHITETLVAVAAQLFNNIEIAGFTVNDDQEAENFLHGTLVVEAIKSMLCKHYGLYHPLQDVAETIFEPDDEGLKFATSLNIELQPMEAIEVPIEQDPEDPMDPIVY